MCSACPFAPFSLQVDGEVSLGESVGLIVWYVFYVLLVVLGRQYRQYMKRKRGLLLDDGSTAEKIAMVRTDEPDSGTTSPADVEGTVAAARAQVCAHRVRCGLTIRLASRATCLGITRGPTICAHDRRPGPGRRRDPV